ncbi:hypothetical protein KC343_g8290, partial [Hortaea werneckii]
MGRQETTSNRTGRDRSADAADQSHELHPAADTQKGDDDRVYHDVRRALQQAGPLDRDELGYRPYATVQALCVKGSDAYVLH